MTTVGNNSTSEAAGITLGSVNVNATAPFNGAITAIHAHVAGNNAFSITISLNGNNVTIPATAPPGYQTVSATGLNIPYTSGQNITLTANFVSAGGGGITSTIILGADLSTPDLWADYSAGGGGGGTAAPDMPSVVAFGYSPTSMTGWSVQYTQVRSSQITQTLGLQRSQDGGSTWTTVDSHTNANGLTIPATFTANDTVSAGPLAYRAFASNGFGTTYQSPVTTITAPTAASVLSIAPASMSSWTINFTGANLVAQYAMQFSSDGGSTWSTGGTVTPPATSGVAAGVPSGALKLRVLYQNSVGSTPSASVDAPLPGAPGAPVLTAVTMTSWSMTWGAGTQAWQYQVQRSTDGGSTWPSVGTVTTSSFTDTSVPAGSLAYRVQAQNSVGNTTGPSTTATAPNFGTTVPTLTEVLA